MPKVNADKFVQNHFKIFLVISIFRIEILFLLHTHALAHWVNLFGYVINLYLCFIFLSFCLSLLHCVPLLSQSPASFVFGFGLVLVCFVCFCNYQCHKKLILTQLKSIEFFLLFFYFCCCCWSVAC